MKRRRVVVIGGGIAGLASAHILTRDGHQVELLEASDQLGGLGTFFPSGDAWIERFYHCIMPTDDDLLGLLAELGIQDDISWEKTTMGMIVDGERFPFNTPLDLLRFRPLSIPQRLRLGVMTLMLRPLGKGKDLDNVRTEDWLCQVFGTELWETIWKPLFKSKFGDQVGGVPAHYLWERLGRESNVATRGYPHGGYHRIIDGLRASITDRGGEIRLNAPVGAIRDVGSGMEVELVDGAVVAADWVVSTVALPLLSEMAAGDQVLEARVPALGLPYQGVVNALFFLDRPLDGHYWSPILGSEAPFDGVVQMSALAGTVPFAGRHLVYTMRYTDRSSELFSETDEDILDCWTNALVEMYRDVPMSRANIVDAKVFRAPFVDAVYPLGYGTIKPPITVEGSRLAVLTSAQVYPRVTSWNSSVGLAKQGAGEFAAQCAREDALA